MTSATPGSAQGLYLIVSDAAAARVEQENGIGAADRDWRDWYAAYMVADQAGTELPR
jgi:hypothetical protein